MARHSLWGRHLSTSTVAVVALAVGACSDGSGGSSGTTPTAPAPPTNQTLGATIEGDVADGADRPISRMTVEVAGTSLSTSTDARGEFRLERVPTGDQVLLFSTSQGRAPLDLRDLRDGERKEISVVVANGSAKLRKAAPLPGVEPLEMRVSPDTWNTNWDKSNGKVTVFFEGEGFDLIDPASVMLVGDDPAQLPLPALSSRVEGHHLKAQFGKRDALALLLGPLPGESRTVIVEFLLDGAPSELPATVRIVGPAG